jgi:hypothetical protein
MSSLQPYLALRQKVAERRAFQGERIKSAATVGRGTMNEEEKFLKEITDEANKFARRQIIIDVLSVPMVFIVIYSVPAIIHYFFK